MKNNQMQTLIPKVQQKIKKKKKKRESEREKVHDGYAGGDLGPKAVNQFVEVG